MRFNTRSSDRKYNYIYLILSILISILISLLMFILFSYLLAFTKINISLAPMMTIVVTLLLAILLTLSFRLFTKLKPFYCSLLSFTAIILLKLLTNSVLSQQVNLSGRGAVNIFFVLIFCFLSAFMAANIKK